MIKLEEMVLNNISKVVIRMVDLDSLEEGLDFQVEDLVSLEEVLALMVVVLVGLTCKIF